MQVVYENALNIYTDGSSYSNPRRGGIGIRYITIDESGNEVIEDHAPPGYKEATNNEMELMACVKGLEGACNHEKIDSVDKVYVFTDSMYVRDHLNRAIYEWPRQKWLNRNGRPIKNGTLWKDLVRQKKNVPRRVEFRWIKGHSKNPHNKAVHKLAKQSANGFLNPPLKVATVRRKITEKSVERGSVRMHGQELDIRIITDTLLRPQRIYEYKYEVISGTSEYYGNVDWLFSEHLLRAGHHYKVRVNDNTKNPRIVEVLNELER
jgi:ribonuclease HI